MAESIVTEDVGGMEKARLRGRMRRSESSAAAEAVVAVVAEHAPALLAHARRFSICADDAHDAYQRALEIFLRRADSLEPATRLAWLRVVLRNEALAVRRSRLRLVGHDEADLDAAEAREAPATEERALGAERVRQSAEALKRLKSQEVTALLLKAEGHSYDEICRITGWSYTKVNRCLTEGRRAFRERLASIESGAECERLAPLLSAVADGEASADELGEVRPHLRACAGCRATVRDFHAAPARAAALLPLPAIAAGLAGSHHAGAGAGVLESAVGTLHEHAVAAAQRVQQGLELLSGSKVAALAASTAVLAGGGAAVSAAVTAPHAAVHHARPARSAARADFRRLAPAPAAAGAGGDARGAPRAAARSVERPPHRRPRRDDSEFAPGTPPAPPHSRAPALARPARAARPPTVAAPGQPGEFSP